MKQPSSAQRGCCDCTAHLLRQQLQNMQCDKPAVLSCSAQSQCMVRHVECGAVVFCCLASTPILVLLVLVPQCHNTVVFRWKSVGRGMLSIVCMPGRQNSVLDAWCCATEQMCSQKIHVQTYTVAQNWCVQNRACVHAWTGRLTRLTKRHTVHQAERIVWPCANAPWCATQVSPGT